MLQRFFRKEEKFAVHKPPKKDKSNYLYSFDISIVPGSGNNAVIPQEALGHQNLPQSCALKVAEKINPEKAALENGCVENLYLTRLSPDLQCQYFLYQPTLQTRTIPHFSEGATRRLDSFKVFVLCPDKLSDLTVFHENFLKSDYRQYARVMVVPSLEDIRLIKEILKYLKNHSHLEFIPNFWLKGAEAFFKQYFNPIPNPGPEICDLSPYIPVPGDVLRIIEGYLTIEEQEEYIRQAVLSHDSDFPSFKK